MEVEVEVQLYGLVWSFCRCLQVDVMCGPSFLVDGDSDEALCKTEQFGARCGNREKNNNKRRDRRSKGE